MKYLWVLLLTFRCCGFSFVENQQLPTTITYSCPDNIADTIVNSLKIWNGVADNIFTFNRVDVDATITYNIGDTPTYGSSLTKRHYWGYTWGTGNKAVINVWKEMSSIDEVILHETGHALGLAHTTDNEATMYPNIQRHNILNQDDIDAIRIKYGLSLKKFDFTLKISGKRIQCITKSKNIEFVFDDGVFYTQRKFVRRLPRGNYWVKLYDTDLHILIKKDFQIK